MFSGYVVLKWYMAVSFSPNMECLFSFSLNVFIIYSLYFLYFQLVLEALAGFLS